LADVTSYIKEYVSSHLDGSLPELNESAPPEVSSTLKIEKATATRRIIASTVGAYLCAALALRLSNITSTHDRVFDLHQLITDQIAAIALALTVYAALKA
jgi:hypothetical protein